MEVRGRSQCGRKTLVPRTCQGLESMLQVQGCLLGRVKAGILESGRKSRERAGMEQGSWFVQRCRLVEPRGFRNGDQEERCLDLFASEGGSRGRVKARRRIDKEEVYIWDGTGVKC